MFNFCKDFLREVEGLRFKVYKDTRGIFTVGYGRNLEDRGITINEAEIMLDCDVNQAVSDLVDIFPNFFDMSENLRVVLVSMMFNLGKSRFLTFKKFIQAVKSNNKQAMMYGLLNSKRAKELPDRVNKEKFLLLRS